MGRRMSVLTAIGSLLRDKAPAGEGWAIAFIWRVPQGVAIWVFVALYCFLSGPGWFAPHSHLAWPIPPTPLQLPRRALPYHCASPFDRQPCFPLVLQKARKSWRHLRPSERAKSTRLVEEFIPRNGSEGGQSDVRQALLRRPTLSCFDQLATDALLLCFRADRQLPDLERCPEALAAEKTQDRIAVLCHPCRALGNELKVTLNGLRIAMG